MSDIVTPLLQWLNANPHYSGLITFIISAAESVAIIGTIVPGSITMTAIGALAGAGVIPLWQTIFWAILGAIIGDSISYWIGHYFKDKLRNMWPFKTNPSVLNQGELFFHKYGVMSVFIGRFVGPVRALVPVVAGMLGMKPMYFTIANVASAIGWAPAYMLPGIMLGAASLELPPDIAMHVIMVLLLIILFIILCFWVAVKILLLINYQTEQLLVRMWEGLKRSRYFHPATVLLKHHDPKEHHGQLTLAFYFLLSSILYISLALYVNSTGADNILINDAFFHLFRGIRSPAADSVMIDITLLGQKQVILPMVAVLFFWFLLTKRTRAAFHALALGILAAGGVFFSKLLIQSPRPWGIAASPETFSMPSGHATLAATVYMGIAFMIASTMRPKLRWMVYLPAALVAVAVGMSRVYLGAHWFTDVLAAWLLSISLLILVILSFHRKHEKHINIPAITIVCLTALSLSYGYYHHKHFTQLKADYALLNWPTAQIHAKEWWEKDEQIPSNRVSLFGFPSQRINVQWAGDLEQIRKTLEKEGWTTPPARDWISTLHRITDINSGDFLPMVSSQYLDKRPALILAKRANGKNKMLVLRLWEANRTIGNSKTPLWVGTVGIVPRSYNWLFRKHHHDQDVTPDVLFTTGAADKQWEWRIINVIQHEGKKKPVEQKILLIRQRK